MEAKGDELIGLSRAKAEFNKVTAHANETGRPVTVLKRNAPWVRIVPLAVGDPGERGKILEQDKAMGITIYGAKPGSDLYMEMREAVMEERAKAGLC